jgi:SAM-dependent methyltransferase
MPSVITGCSSSGLVQLPSAQIVKNLAGLIDASPEQIGRELQDPLVRQVIAGTEKMRLGVWDDGRVSYVGPVAVLRQAGLRSWAGTRVLDYGCGAGAWLANIAAAGARATGIEVPAWATTRVTISEPDGVNDLAPPAPGVPPARRLLGNFPAWPDMREAVGGGYDIILSKNVLKKSYVREDFVQLGATDEAFLGEMHDRLKPGGLFLIMNLGSRPQAGAPAKGAEDAHAAFTGAQLRAAGFEVLADDVDASAVSSALLVRSGYDPEELGADKVETRVTLARRAMR